jgi:hypothetical protein
MMLENWFLLMTTKITLFYKVHATWKEIRSNNCQALRQHLCLQNGFLMQQVP